MDRRYIAPIGEELYIVNTGDWRAFRPVIDQDRCSRCGICLLFCPVNMIRRVEGRFAVDYSYCKGCGICAQECPKGAVAMVEEGSVA